MGLVRVNSLSEAERHAVCLQLVPPRCFDALSAVDIERYGGEPGSKETLRIIGEPKHELHIRVPARRMGGDYAFSLDLEEAGAGQMQIGFIVINDLASPRFDIDVDEHGHLTLLGTASRNFVQEERAMRAGLGPCQVRRGLRMFSEVMPRLEAFAKQQGYVAIVLEPLTYHNAVMYEKYGFAYITGKRRMIEINEGFRPGNVLHEALDGSTPFRQPEYATTPRGRSWAIHDGILQQLDGNEEFNVQMVKVIDEVAQQRTFEL